MWITNKTDNRISRYFCRCFFHIFPLLPSVSTINETICNTQNCGRRVIQGWFNPLSSGNLAGKTIHTQGVNTSQQLEFSGIHDRLYLSPLLESSCCLPGLLYWRASYNKGTGNIPEATVLDFVELNFSVTFTGSPYNMSFLFILPNRRW